MNENKEKDNLISSEYDCRTSEQCMNAFINNELTDYELYCFLNHVIKCASCYEELETSYLLSEALSRLEEGETIDLENELKQKVKNSRKALRIHGFIGNIYRSAEIISMIIVLLFLLNIIIARI